MKKLLIIVLAVTLMAVVAQADTLLHYDFSDGSGGTVTDLAGTNHGTLGGFTDTSAGAGQFGVSEGWVTGGGLSTLADGARNFVSTPLLLTAVPGDWTIEYQASADGPSGDYTPAIATNQSAWDGAKAFFLGLHNPSSSNQVQTPGWGGGQVGSHPYSVPGDQSDPSVHHIAAVYDSTTNVVEMFVDGVSVASTTQTGINFGGAGDSLFRICSTNWGWGSAASEEWDGILYGVAISDTKLAPGDFVIPEPMTLFLLGLGGLGLIRRRK